MEVDPLLDVLAMAETGSDDQFGDVLQSAHPVTASGGLSSPWSPTSTRSWPAGSPRCASPVATALAIVLDPDGFTATRRRRGRGATSSPASRCCAVPGWSVAVVGAGDDLPSVWGVLSGTTHRVGVA